MIKKTVKKIKTKRKIKNQIRCTEDKIGSILNSIGEAVFTLDKNFKIKTFNPAAEKLSGFLCRDVIGLSAKRVLKLKDEKTGRQTYWPFAEVLRKNEIIKLTNQSDLVTQDKKEIPIAYNVSPLKDVKGSVIGLIIVFRDVTKEREVQKMKSEFVAIVSHQLRTPSSAVKWYLETLLENNRGNKINKWQFDHLQQAYQSNERMINLINDLLNVSRIESGKLKLDIKPVNIGEIFNDVIKEMGNFARANNVIVENKISKNRLAFVKADTDKIRQVIQNLVNNAIKYTQGKQKVIINFKKEKNNLKFWIKDHGIGIPEEQLRRIFERFFRAENAITSQTEGSGLGLYIAKKIIALHKGEIWLESDEGKGTTFYFTLPIAKKSKI